MNTTPIPSSIHAAARRQALALRNEAISNAFSGLLAAVRRLLPRAPRATNAEAPCRS